MDEISLLNVHYTEEAVKGALAIKSYLLKKFTQREVDNFYKLLRGFEKIVSSFPLLYPRSDKNKNTHRAVLSKKLSVFYKVQKNGISIIAILDNRMDYSKWP